MAKKNKKKDSLSIKKPTLPMRLWQDRSSGQEVRIEILPLIDVIFCILTFFILGAVGLSRQQAISLDLPKAETGTSQMQEMLVVSIDENGQLYLEKQRTNQTQLNQAIVNYYQQNPSGIVVLHASRKTSYNNVVEVLDLLRDVGGDRIALATLPGESESIDTQNYFNLNPANTIPNQNNLGLPTQPNTPNNNSRENSPTQPNTPNNNNSRENSPTQPNTPNNNNSRENSPTQPNTPNNNNSRENSPTQPNTSNNNNSRENSPTQPNTPNNNNSNENSPTNNSE